MHARPRSPHVLSPLPLILAATLADPPRPTRPEAKPFIEGIYISPDGKLWVEVLRTAGNRWELFDTGGRLLGTFPVRPRKEDAAPVFGPDHLVTIRQDSLDLDHVDVWRIDRAGR